MRSIIAVVVLLAATTVSAQVVTKEDAGLRYSIPTTWVRIPAPSDMRAAQYRIPGEGTASGEMVLFFFGKGQGGSTEQNLERWYAQFTQPDGRASRDAAVVTIRTVGALKVTSVDLTGTYSPTPMRAGAPAASQPGTRMLAAVVEGDGGPWFFRLVGSEGIVGGAKPDFEKLVLSLEPHA